ncbi:hypothetical protein NE237_018842 [Protea cynaroides]|uniref:Uncharacterized protein n=1 Tax=Protea cynaroides TaxID=273540 RepID=A0A9Q0KAM3_9MAGN|nr:hypothetical protein NE237_018842 [Protea cynaroides]
MYMCSLWRSRCLNWWDREWEWRERRILHSKEGDSAISKRIKGRSRKSLRREVTNTLQKGGKLKSPASSFVEFVTNLLFHPLSFLQYVNTQGLKSLVKSQYNQRSVTPRFTSFS